MGFRARASHTRGAFDGRNDDCPSSTQQVRSAQGPHTSAEVSKILLEYYQHPLYAYIRGHAAGERMVFGLSVLNREYNFSRACPKQGLNLSLTWYGRTIVINYGVYSILSNRSVYFVICPKQGPKMEGVVLHRVGILGLFLS